MSTDLENGIMVKTVQRENLTINIANGIMVNDAKVVQADNDSTNGAIHAIDTLLMPNKEVFSFHFFWAFQP